MPLSALLTAALLAAPQGEVDPMEALRRSLERRPGVNFDAWVEKPFPGGDAMKVRMQVDVAGRRRTEVFGPLAVQGRVFIDDGSAWIAYFPDTKTLRVHPAPPNKDDLDTRMKLIRRNYQVTIEGKPVLAGRPALLVVATPRNQTLKTHRFVLDAATYVPLKSETVDGLGNISVAYTIRRISFPSRMERSTFEEPSVEGMRRETRKPPTPVPLGNDAVAAEKKLGFAPAMPGRIPAGFRVQGADILDWKGVTPLAIRMTDGLVRVTVFQFRTNGQPAPPTRPEEGPRVAKDMGEVRIEVRGDDVPVAIRERILGAYVRVFSRTKAQVGDSRHAACTVPLL